MEVNNNNKRTLEHEDDGPSHKKAREGEGLETTFTSFVASWEAEKTKLETEKAKLAAEKKAWEDAKQTRIVVDSPVRLNVGGVRFEATPETLTAHGGAFFASMLYGRPRIEPCGDGSYFIDRDPTQFPLILNYLSGSRLDLKSLPVPELETFKAEAEFYTLISLVEKIDEVLKPSFKPSARYSLGGDLLNPMFRGGPCHTLDCAWHTVTKTASEGWNATVRGPMVRTGDTSSIQILKSSSSCIAVGLAPFDISGGFLNHTAPEYLMLNCFDGALINNGASIPYYGRQISAPSIVEVQLARNGDVCYIIDGVKQAKAFSVVVGKPYHLYVWMGTYGDQVRLR